MDDPTTPQEFGSRLLGGLSWTVSSQLASQVVTFVVGVLLARLLVPSDFGILSMALAYVGFLWLLGQAGFNSAIVYLDDIRDVDLCTMYWANLAINLVLFGVALVLAPLIAQFFQTQEVVPVVRVASLLLVVSALGGVQRTLLEKRMDFRRLARNQLAGSLVYAVTAATMALAGMGVWALVVGRLLGDAMDSALGVISTRWLPKMVFSRTSLSRLFRYGSRVWLGNVLFYGQENIDNLVVGRLLGATPLGYYSFAFRLANVPRYFFAGVVNRVMFPSFSSDREQPQLLKRAFLRVNSYSILIAGGLSLGLALVAPEVVAVVYGPKWVPAIAALSILSVAAGIYCASQVTVPVLLAMGRPGLHAKVVFGSSTVLLVCALAGARYYGIEGVALGVLAAATVAFGAAQFSVARILTVRGEEYRHAVLPPLMALTSMSIVVEGWRWLGLGAMGLGPTVWLIAAIALGAMALVGGFILTDPAAHLADLLMVLRSLRGRKDVELAETEPG